MSVLSQIPTIAKAITGAVAAFGAAFAVAVTDQIITTPEWVAIAVSTIIAGVGVWAVPNRPPTPQ